MHPLQLTRNTARRNLTQQNPQSATVWMKDLANQGLIKIQVDQLQWASPKLRISLRFSTLLLGMQLLQLLTRTFQILSLLCVVKQHQSSVHKVRIKLGWDQIKLITHSNPNFNPKLRDLRPLLTDLKVENISKVAVKSNHQTRRQRQQTTQAHPAVSIWILSLDEILVHRQRMSNQPLSETTAKNRSTRLSWMLRPSQATTVFNGRSQPSAHPHK